RDYASMYLHGQKMLEIAKRKNLGGPAVGASDWMMAEGARRLGRLDEAERLHREGLRLRQASLEPNDYRVLQSLDGLALTLTYESRLGDAEPYFIRAIAGFDAIVD